MKPPPKYPQLQQLNHMLADPRPAELPNTEILRVIGGNAVQAAVQAIEQMRQQQRKAFELEVE